MHPMIYLTYTILDELGQGRLEASEATSNLGAQRAATQRVTLLQTDHVGAPEHSPEAPNLLVTPHLIK